MGFLTRGDGVLVRDAAPVRRMLPFLAPRRNEAIVYFEQMIDVTKTLAFLEEDKKRHSDSHLSLFHIVLASMARAIGQRPHMNRFIAGSKIYQRKDIAISFVVKKKFSDDASMTAVKVVFDPDATLDDVAQRVERAISTGRGDRKTSSEVEMGIVTRLPGFLIRFLLWLQRRLDGCGLLPHALTVNDPMYASMFVANLGSIGLSAPFHHLYEYGTIPIFCTIGKVVKAPIVDEHDNIVVRNILPLRYSFDERITDGFYCARSLQLFETYIKDPAQLQ